MSEVLITAERLGKKYCKSLRRGLLYGAEDIARSYIGMRPNNKELRVDEFWSLHEVSFEVKRGECLGLIGPNGAGKSSLLKILNGIVAPNRGRVSVRGKVGALIEVGAGFHPLLTGRENIYLNGAILGLSRAEINRKFDAIVDFADIDNFIDMPVKHYSSGMHVRLGFAIAAQMEPDILLIDEILAVGDAGFRSKCYNAIGHLAQRTAIVFVSHSMPMISRLASQTLLIDHGNVAFQGTTTEAIIHYHRLFSTQTSSVRFGSGEATIASLHFLAPDDQPKTSVSWGDPLIAELRVTSDLVIRGVHIDLVFTNIAEEVAAECNMRLAGKSVDLAPGNTLIARAYIHQFSLNPGIYKVSALVLSENGIMHYDWQKDLTFIEVTGSHVGIANQQFGACWKTSMEPNSMQKK